MTLGKMAIIGGEEVKQTNIPMRCDLLPPYAIMAVANVLKEAVDKYGAMDDATGMTTSAPNWRAIPVNDHLNHAMAHILRHLSGDKSEDHLEHAATRLLFAVDISLGKAGE